MSDETFAGVDVDELAALAGGEPGAMRRLILELQTNNDALKTALSVLLDWVANNRHDVSLLGMRIPTESYIRLDERGDVAIAAARALLGRAS